VDYSATPTTVDDSGWSTDRDFTITLLDDAVMEADETFFVTIGMRRLTRVGLVNRH
jgi:hypothetical protein